MAAATRLPKEMQELQRAIEDSKSIAEEPAENKLRLTHVERSSMSEAAKAKGVCMGADGADLAPTNANEPRIKAMRSNHEELFDGSSPMEDYKSCCACCRNSLKTSSV